MSDVPTHREAVAINLVAIQEQTARPGHPGQSRLPLVDSIALLQVSATMALADEVRDLRLAIERAAAGGP